MEGPLAFIGFCVALYFFVRLIGRVVRHYKWARLQAKWRRERFDRLAFAAAGRMIQNDDHIEYYH